MVPVGASDRATWEALRDTILGNRVSAALYVVAKLGIADLLAGGAKGSEDLAHAVGAHPRSLYRVLRLLASQGVSNDVIAARLDTPRQIVSKWRQRFMPSDSLVSTSDRTAGDRRAFPPSVVVEVKALACELPSRRDLPLARWTCSELRREVMAQGLVAEISGTTL